MNELGVDHPQEPPRREPFLRAPPVLVILCLALVGLYALQAHFLGDARMIRWALSWPALSAGHWETLLTYQFLHGSWAHVGLNAVWALALGTPAARLMGARARGIAAFSLFYLTCGILAGLGALAWMWGQPTPLIGASGAISGLVGAASRMVWRPPGELGPIFSRTVAAMTVPWIIANVLLGVLGLTPGAGDMPVAWQAHIAGYLAGLLLVGPFAFISGQSRTDHALER